MTTNPTKEQTLETLEKSEYQIREEARRKDLEDWKAGFKNKYPHGYIISEHEQNGYHDSYFSETLFLADEMKIVSVSTGATAYGCPAYSSLLPWLKDAPMEIKEAYKQMRLKDREESLIKDTAVSAQAYCTSVQIESEIKLVKNVKSKGETYEKGLIGKVFWIGKDSYSDNPRYGLKFEDGRKAFVTASQSLELVPKFVPSIEKQNAYIKECMDHSIALPAEEHVKARGGQWYTPNPLECYGALFVTEI